MAARLFTHAPITTAIACTVGGSSSSCIMFTIKLAVEFAVLTPSRYVSLGPLQDLDMKRMVIINEWMIRMEMSSDAEPPSTSAAAATMSAKTRRIWRESGRVQRALFPQWPTVMVLGNGIQFGADGVIGGRIKVDDKPL